MNIIVAERINEANQYTEHLIKEYQRQGHNVILDPQNFLFSSYLPDIVHIQWPEAIYRFRHKLPKDEKTFNLIEDRLTWYKKNGVVIVYTIHNYRPHSSSSLFDKNIFDLILECADVVVHHGKISLENIKKSSIPVDSDNKHIICPHGPYDFTPFDSIIARGEYNLPKDK